MIEIAARLFLEKGYHLTSMDEVVHVSGISKSNIYYHFKNKEELAIGVIKWRISLLEQHIDELVRSKKSYKEKLNKMVALISNQECLDHDKGGCPFISLYLQAAQQSPRIHTVIKNFFLEQVPVVEEILQSGIAQKQITKAIDVRKTAKLIISTLEGALLLSEITADQHYMDDSLQTLTALLD
ncbi:transcriptional regulator, TetR family [Melghirimyces algeriensis]|uniref:Transcriptional regulator, TetR family n=1 Tax=Melghirimyces algeriensis TaxID=910412 RepID=A0A521D9G3_9BACL|nr:transcriptional regulator, TetR family [Melghirimyces algeriensis]